MKRTGKSKKKPTLIVGLALPEKGLEWYQRLIEKGATTKRGAYRILPFHPFYRANKIKGKAAKRKTLENLKRKFIMEAKKKGFGGFAS